uniref:Uncharacterized protein n=1 Tax=Arundo donax TaxID=35708 RepID=A0A0A9H9N1_ARUDO
MSIAAICLVWGGNSSGSAVCSALNKVVLGLKLEALERCLDLLDCTQQGQCCPITMPYGLMKTHFCQTRDIWRMEITFF